MGLPECMDANGQGDNDNEDKNSVISRHFLKFSRENMDGDKRLSPKGS